VGSCTSRPTTPPILARMLNIVDGVYTWRPLTSEENRHLERGDRLRYRDGREWTVRAAAYLDPEAGEHRAVLVAGAPVVIERERFCDGVRASGRRRLS